MAVAPGFGEGSSRFGPLFHFEKNVEPTYIFFFAAYIDDFLC